MLPDAVVEIGPGQIEFRGQFRENELGVLETGDRLSEGGAFLHVFQGLLEHSLGGRDRADGQREALLRQIVTS